jgi:hypothetical protein
LYFGRKASKNQSGNDAPVYFTPQKICLSFEGRELYRTLRCAAREKFAPEALRGEFSSSSDDLGNHARANGTTAFTDSEAQTFIHGDRVDQLTTSS